MKRSPVPSRLLAATLALLLATVAVAAEPEPLPAAPCVEARLLETDPAGAAAPARPATGADSGQGPDIGILKRRYGHDPTGARARLGMCRRGQHPHPLHNDGPHRRHRGGERGTTP